MAIVTCPECHNEISDTAVCCPTCGYPYADKVKIYQSGIEKMQNATNEKSFLKIAEMFHTTSGLFDSDALEKTCREKAAECKIESEKRAEENQTKIESKKKEISEQVDKYKLLLTKNKKKIIGIAIVIALSIVSIPVATKFLVPAIKYSNATKLLETGDYEQAETIFRELDSYKDSKEMVNEAIYLHGKELHDNGEFESAIKLFQSLEKYKDSPTMVKRSIYAQANNLLNQKKYTDALSYYKQCEEFEDTAEILDKVGVELAEQGQYEDALSYLYLHNDSEEQIRQINYDYLCWQMENREYSKTASTYNKIKDYKDVDTNDMFVGAKLLAAEKIEYSKMNFTGSIIMYMDSESAFFTFNPDKLVYYNHRLSGSAFSLNDPITDSGEWAYYFDGCDLYYRDADGTYKHGGTFGSFVPPTDDKPGTVTVTMKLPQIKSFSNTTFEYNF